MPSVFVTGASRGLGLEFVRQYAAAGWNVVAACREPSNTPALAELGPSQAAACWKRGDFRPTAGDPRD